MSSKLFGGSGGGAKFSQFSRSFLENLAKSYVGPAHPPEGGHPSYRESFIRPCLNCPRTESNIIVQPRLMIGKSGMYVIHTFS